MFRRVVTDTWQDWTPYAAFGITFLIFTAAFIRTLLMRRERVDHLSRLPLDEGEPAAKSDNRN